MKKKYQKPVLESHTVYGICGTDSLTMATGSGNDMAKKRDDDDYEVESDNYGGVW